MLEAVKNANSTAEAAVTSGRNRHVRARGFENERADGVVFTSLRVDNGPTFSGRAGAEPRWNHKHRPAGRSVALRGYLAAGPPAP
jgi:hypothetical protein